MRLILNFLLALGTASALPILTIPNGQTYSTLPGATLPLPFSITSDTQFYTVITSVQGTVDTLGAVSDVLSVFVSNQSYALAPNTPAWTESFTPLLAGQTAGSVGTLLVPNATLPGLYNGSLLITYDLFDLNPFLDGAAQGVGSGSLQAAFTVRVDSTSNVPEPGPALLFAIGLTGIVIRRVRL